MSTALNSNASKPEVLRACIYCHATGLPLVGEGLRKRCSSLSDCAARVKANDPNLRPRPTLVPNGKTPNVSELPNTRAGSPAEALIDLMQQRAKLDELDGPVEISDSLHLPLQSLLMRAVAFGKPNCGKTNASAVMIENCYANNVPVAVIDILGRLWGLRARGSAAGIAIPIIGGDHGDLELKSEDGTRLARLVAKGQSMIIDLSLLTREAQQWFAADFFKELMRSLRIPAMIVVEEAETIVPAFSRGKAHFASQGAVSLWARQCRNYGSGWFFSTQRIQLLHADVIDASNLFMAMQTTGDRSSHAIFKEATSRVGKTIASAILAELGQLAQGETWLLPDPSWLGDTYSAPIKIKLRKRVTYDSTAIPVIGQPMPTSPPLTKTDVKALLDEGEPAAKAVAGSTKAKR